jgi:hypothetical protein
MKSMLFFDLSDLFAECRLGDVQPVGCPSEVHLFGQDNDCLQVTHFDPGEHRSTPFRQTAEIVNALHLAKEPPRGRKQQKRSWDERRKENYKVLKYFDAFAPQTVPKLVLGKSR